jgi:hypothetical protein
MNDCKLQNANCIIANLKLEGSPSPPHFSIYNLQFAFSLLKIVAIVAKPQVAGDASHSVAAAATST